MLPATWRASPQFPPIVRTATRPMPSTPTPRRLHPEALYEDVTSTHLPSGLLTGLSMDAGAGDVDVGVRVTIWENSSDFGRITGFDETQEQTFRVDRADRGL